MTIGRCKVFLHSYVYWQNSAGNFSPQKKLFNVAVGRNHENLAVGRSKNLSQLAVALIINVAVESKFAQFRRLR